jgi:hypothetical protein
MREGFPAVEGEDGSAVSHPFRTKRGMDGAQGIVLSHPFRNGFKKAGSSTPLRFAQRDESILLHPVKDGQRPIEYS